MIPGELKHKNPAIDIRMLVGRQFGTCFSVMLATGALLLATAQYLPQLVQQDLGNTATWTGLMLSPGGVVTMVMMFVVGFLSPKPQPKYLIAIGAGFVALSMYQVTNIYSGVGFWYLAEARMLQGTGLPFTFLPITSASYDGIPANKTDQASALLNAARNTGGSIGVSLISNIITHRKQFHQSRLIEHVVPPNGAYQQTLGQVTSYFAVRGSSLTAAQRQALGWVNQQIQSQASLLSYVDAFWVLTLNSLAAIPLALTLRNVALGEKASARDNVRRLPPRKSAQAARPVPGGLQRRVADMYRQRSKDHALRLRQIQNPDSCQGFATKRIGRIASQLVPRALISHRGTTFLKHPVSSFLTEKPDSCQGMKSIDPQAFDLQRYHEH